MNYTVNVSIPKPLADLAHEQVKRGHYATLSEVMRAALRKLLVKDDVPVYKMSKRAERRAKIAYQEYLDGKAIKINSVDELI